ncbi:tetratricopeptide repeat protein [Rhodanobacter sp. KK11]|jgi:tetratricopeptide (TPR) repeat protein|uniref:tetratricopeptide repeat protein n=1 Tax=Rhodanobacter sp. KK11 TaxID=3083255 RepID=UPI00296691B8|nr:tetratricopeptide repeat protein [Rhodanobacter sp. KK11]MDW2980600.1 tetratricopeptide repeat protein [Rhodanobacter sp. KK11]
MRTNFSAIYWIAPPLFCLLACVSYYPGLHGGFLFDDFANLPVLGASGPIDNWPVFWRYITSGIADPTGRPLTLLTFLLDANNWPADPFPFKRTNLILHLLNGALLYTLLAQLAGLLGYSDRRSRTAALLGTALWLLHPLLVSTTLYIVQREAMLPATCVMAGLLIWLHGRHQLTQGRTAAGLTWSTLGLGGFTVLGVLAKANGVLLPILALLIELVVLARRHVMHHSGARQAYRLVLFALVIAPSAAILGYLFWTGFHGTLAGGPVGSRPWSVGQRLLTEPRVLLDYLQLLWLPRPFSSGLFNDQYIASTSWLQPITTLPAMLAVLGLVGLAWWQRRQRPALALALLFYFAGQLLESTSIPLELYFEHRNYLPALLMFWPLGLWLADTRKLHLLKYALMLVLPLGLAWMTYARAELWGNVHSQALLWAKINPNSARAQTNAAQIEMQAGQPQAAIQRLEKLLAHQPDQVQLAFNLIGARCMTGGITAADLAAAQLAMQGTPNTGTLFANWFERTLPVAMSGGCPGLTAQGLQKLLDTGLANPKLSAAGPQQDLTYLRGKIALAQDQPDAALADFIHALDLQVRPGMALEAAATLGRAGYPSHGLRLLDHYEAVSDKAMKPGFGMPWLHEWVLKRQNYWSHELEHLRHQLALDAAANRGNTSNHSLQPGVSA